MKSCKVITDKMNETFHFCECLCHSRFALTSEKDRNAAAAEYTKVDEKSVTGW